MATLTTIRNIGPKMAQHFKNAGISTAEEVYTLGLEKSYRRLLSAGTTRHFMAFIALAAGLEGRKFDDHSPEEKQELRKQYDTIIASIKKRSDETPNKGIEAFLNDIGVVDD